MICEREKIQYEKEALDMIIHRSRGSLRDSLTMLEKCIIESSLTTHNVESALHLVNTHFLKKTFEAIRSGQSEQIQDIIDALENESTDIRQFSAQMTEWIVDNIQGAFEQKEFPLYREIFDLFTGIFIQSKQVAVPMDILRMALYERIQDSIKPREKAQKVSREPETIKNIAPETHILETSTHELPPSGKELSPPSHELPIATELPPAENIIEAAKAAISQPSDILIESAAVLPDSGTKTISG